jgi:DNA-3-methyladenine glycosylase I
MPHREVFMDFDPVLVSKLSEKKIIAPGSPSSSLLSEQKLRGVIENARQILKVSSYTIVTHVFYVSQVQ